MSNTQEARRSLIEYINDNPTFLTYAIEESGVAFGEMCISQLLTILSRSNDFGFYVPPLLEILTELPEEERERTLSNVVSTSESLMGLHAQTEELAASPQTSAENIGEKLKTQQKAEFKQAIVRLSQVPQLRAHALAHPRTHYLKIFSTLHEQMEKHNQDFSWLTNEILGDLIFVGHVIWESLPKSSKAPQILTIGRLMKEVPEMAGDQRPMEQAQEEPVSPRIEVLSIEEYLERKKSGDGAAYFDHFTRALETLKAPEQFIEAKRLLDLVQERGLLLHTQTVIDLAQEISLDKTVTTALISLTSISARGRAIDVDSLKLYLLSDTKQMIGDTFAALPESGQRRILDAIGEVLNATPDTRKSAYEELKKWIWLVFPNPTDTDIGQLGQFFVDLYYRNKRIEQDLSGTNIPVVYRPSEISLRLRDLCNVPLRYNIPLEQVRVSVMHPHGFPVSSGSLADFQKKNEITFTPYNNFSTEYVLRIVVPASDEHLRGSKTISIPIILEKEKIDSMIAKETNSLTEQLKNGATFHRDANGLHIDGIPAELSNVSFSFSRNEGPTTTSVEGGKATLPIVRDRFTPDELEEKWLITIRAMTPMGGNVSAGFEHTVDLKNEEFVRDLLRKVTPADLHCLLPHDTVHTAWSSLKSKRDLNDQHSTDGTVSALFDLGQTIGWHHRIIDLFPSIAKSNE